MIVERHQSRGDLAVYMALIVMSIVLSSAILFSLLLVNQLRATEDAVSSERAFYAANSGLEHGLYHLSLFTDPNPTELTGTLSYPAENASSAYQATAKYGADGLTACVLVTGAYPILASQSYPDNAPSALKRRLEVGPDECFP